MEDSEMGGVEVPVVGNSYPGFPHPFFDLAVKLHSIFQNLIELHCCDGLDVHIIQQCKGPTHFWNIPCQQFSSLAGHLCVSLRHLDFQLPQAPVR